MIGSGSAGPTHTTNNTKGKNINVASQTKIRKRI
jgi:hypothetical protein